MGTFIEITEGELAGTKFLVSEGLTLGRTKSDYTISDMKISARHAQIDRDEAGDFVLRDLGSANGIIMNGSRFDKIKLLQDVTFILGLTQFRVVVEPEPKLGGTPAPKKKLTWQDVIRIKCNDLKKSTDVPTSILQRFNPPIRLHFLKGIQADQEIILGYGPRLVGGASLDVELMAEDAPQLAFRLNPQIGNVEIEAFDKYTVKVNEKHVDKIILNDGDLISVGNTLIKITYI